MRDREARVLPLLLALLGLAWPAGIAAAEPGGRAATVILSSGESLTGELRVTDDRPLDLYEVSQKKRYKVALAELAGLTTEIESEKLQDGWVFVEEGSDKKVKLDFKYPLRKYLTVLRLTGGAQLKGHIAAVLYLRPPGDDEAEERRLFLLADHKGERGQALTDLVYVKEIRFGDAPPGPAAPAEARLGALAADLPGALELRVVDADRDKGFDAPRVRGSDAFRADGLLPGRYDLFARTVSGLCGVLTAPTARPLTDADRAALRARVAEIEEFFDEKRILAYAGGPDRAKLLLELRRTKPTTMKEESSQESYKFIRWEVWTLHRLQTTWQVDARIFLFRARVNPHDPFPEAAWRETGALGGVEVGGGREAKVAAELAR